MSGILAVIVSGAAQASTPEELLDELGTFPDIEVIDLRGGNIDRNTRGNIYGPQ